MCWVVAVSLCMALLAFLVYASACISSGVYLKALCKGDPWRNSIALTFDDGPDEDMTPKVLDVLKKYGVQAVFFVVGSKAEKHPEIMKRIRSEGHLIGSHTFSHSPFFPMRGRKYVSAELDMVDEAVFRHTGSRIRLFRPPFGVTNPVIGREVRRRGYITLGWSIRSLDTLTGKSREEVADRVAARLHHGAVILLHDRLPDADMLLEMIINEVLAKNVLLERADRLLEID